MTLYSYGKLKSRVYVSIEKYNLLDCSCMEMFGYGFTKQLADVCSRSKFMGSGWVYSESKLSTITDPTALDFTKNGQQ